MEAQDSVGLEIAEAVTDVLRGGRIRNAINMPSVDPKDVAALAPYLNLCQRLGSFARQAAHGEVESISIVYWGSIVDLDAYPLPAPFKRDGCTALRETRA